MDDHQPIRNDDAAEERVEGNHGRRSDRDSMYLAATVRVRGSDTAIAVRVRNLSAGGLMVDGMPACNAGDSVTLTLGRIGEVEGQVAWIEPDRAGIAFLQPIDPHQARRPVGVAGTPRKSPLVSRTRRSGLRGE